MRKPCHLAALSLVLTISSNLAPEPQAMLLFDHAEAVDGIVRAWPSLPLTTDFPSVLSESTARVASSLASVQAVPDTPQNGLGVMTSEWMHQAQEWAKDPSLMLIIVCGFLLLVAVLITFLVSIRRRRRTTPQAHGIDSKVAEGKYSPPFCLLRDLNQVTGREDYDITGRLTRISRAPAQDTPQVRTIVIKDSHISREHALIEYRNYGYWLSDRGSVNGTFVNGKRLTGERLLKHGDCIRFHKYDFEIDLPEVADEGQTVLAETPPTENHMSPRFRHLDSRSSRFSPLQLGSLLTASHVS